MSNTIGQATYRIGPDDFFTGDDLNADAQTLEGMVKLLDAKVEGNPDVPKDLVTAWVLFQSQWEGWYYSTFVGSSFLGNLWTALNDGNRDQLIQFENRFADLASQLANNGVSAPGVDVVGSQGAPDTVASFVTKLDNAARKLLPFGLGLGAFLVIAFVVWYFVLPRLAVRAA